MNIGDILRITVKQSLFGQECLNVFFYEVRDVDGVPAVDLPSFVPSYTNEFANALMPVLSNDLSVVSTLLENLTDIDEFGEFATPHVGANASDAFSSQSAMTVKQLRSLKVTRSGSKRFAGVPEGKVTDGLLTLGANEIDPIESFLTGNIAIPRFIGDTSEILLRNTIVGRTKNAQGIYELDLTKLNPVADATINLNVSTQNSRKRR